MIAPANFRAPKMRFVTLDEKRRQWTREHSAFLTWALEQERTGRPLPRIPRKRVDQGGWSATMRTPGGRALVRRWWRRMLAEVAWG